MLTTLIPIVAAVAVLFVLVLWQRAHLRRRQRERAESQQMYFEHIQRAALSEFRRASPPPPTKASTNTVQSDARRRDADDYLNPLNPLSPFYPLSPLYTAHTHSAPAPEMHRQPDACPEPVHEAAAPCHDSGGSGSFDSGSSGGGFDSGSGV